jgi:RHS repeat-associated protein
LVPSGVDALPLSWLTALVAVPGAWATPTPPLPVPRSGSAGGRGHRVSAAQTRAGGGTGRPPGRGQGQLKAYQQHQPAAVKRVTPALAGEASFNPKTSKRIASASSAKSSVYQNVDGSYTRTVYEAPMNYQADDGSWQPIDTSLVQLSDGRWHERANGVAVDFAATAADPVLASVSFDAGHAIGYGLDGAQPATAVVSGSRVMYPEVAPATDLQVDALPQGTKETLVLHTAAAGSSWVFPLALTGLSPVVAADGGVQFVDGSGVSVARIAAPSMADSNVDPHSGEAASSRSAAYSVVTVGGQPALRLTVDAGWLADPARVFPVRVDPSYIFWITGSTYADTADGGDNSGNPVLKVGTSDGGASIKAYSFLQFSSFGSVFNGAKMTAVSLHLFDVWAYTCATRPFEVHAVTQGWTPSGVTTYPGPSWSATTLGQGSVAPGAACSNTSLDPTVGQSMGVTLTDLSPFNQWSTGGANYGLAVTASQTDSTQWKKFASVNSPNPPWLSVTYTPDQAPTVDASYPPDNYSSPTLTPELLAHATDTDNWPVGAPVTYTFSLYDTQGNLLNRSSASASGLWQVPAGEVEWGRSYLWTVTTSDGQVSSESDPHYFTAVPPQPVVTSHLSQNGGHGYDATAGNYTTSVTDAQIPTVGPALSIRRAYNSQDPRLDEALGAGWSSQLDMQVAEQYSGTGEVVGVVVTYPSGEEVAFARRNDGTFAPPSGRVAELMGTGDGYELVDKTDTEYVFDHALPGGVWGLVSMADAYHRAETYSYSGDLVTTVTSASGRSLHLTWTTPVGATAAHVATVVTDPAVPGSAGTALTWSYSYSGDQLTAVCPPTSATACTRYAYSTAPRYPNTVLDAGAQSYWRLNETSGTTAASSILVNEHADNATYSNVTLGQPGPLPGSTSTAAGFDGSSSYVDLTGGSVTKALVTYASYLTVSLWFKTTTAGGVLFSYQADPVSNASTPADYTPALYVGSDGRLLGEFWDGTVTPITSGQAVTDGAWHFVVLTGAGDTQTMYLDGAAVGTKTGHPITLFRPANSLHEYLGVGFIGGGWPDEPHQSSSGATAYPTYFTGVMAEAAVFHQYLPAATVTALYRAGTTATKMLSTVTRPSGNIAARVAYGTSTGRVLQVTDENGGTWAVHYPSVSGSSQVFASAVLGSAPADYWRLGDSGGATAVNQVHGGVASYSSVTLGAAGVFSDATAAGLNGSSSYLALPSGLIPSSGAMSFGLWFKTSTAGRVLFAYQASPLSAGTSPGNYSPALYVGSDGKLRGEFYVANLAPFSSAASVADGKWHYAVLATSGSAQKMYLDGQPIASASGTVSMVGQSYVYVGAGFLGGGWPDNPNSGVTNAPVSYFNGTVADVAFYRGQLSDSAVSAQYAASKSSQGLTPVESAKVDDPGGHTLVYATDPRQGNRMLAATDALGQTTTYGYDTSGFLDTTTDPDGNVTVTGHDGDGNMVAKTTCQDLAANACSTTYYSYRANPVGQDVAKGGTVTASSTYTSGGWNAGALVDGNVASTGASQGWTSAAFGSANSSVSVVVDLGSAHMINQVNLYPRNDGVYTGWGFPQDFTVATSTDGLIYSTAAIRSGYPRPTTAGPQVFRIPRVNARYVRIAGSLLRPDRSGGTSYFMQFAELTAFDTTPDPVAGAQLTVRDGRSASATDTTYLTSFGYDAAGNRTTTTTPPVPGFPSGRTTRTVYSDDLTVAADGGTTPAGLPEQITSPGGAVTRVAYLHTGDVAATVDAAGLVTRYGYDGLGRQVSRTTGPDGPVSWWRLNQGTGQTVPDGSGTGNTGVSSNVSWSGDAAVFDGASSDIAATAPGVNTGTSFSLSAWVDLSSLGASAWILGASGNHSYAADLAYSGTTGKFKFETTDADVRGPVSSVASGGVSATAGAWTHVVGVYDAAAGTMRLYVNGTASGSASPASTWAATRGLHIGSDGSALYFPGSVANVQLYQRALATSEIATLYSAGHASATTVGSAAAGRLTTTFDGQNRVTTQVAPAFTDRVTGAVHTPTTTTGYDVDGNITSVTVGDQTGGDAARTRTATYDAHDQLWRQTDANQNTTVFGYDAYGNQTSQTDPAGNETDLAYNANRQLISTVLRNYTGDPANPVPATDLVRESRAYDPAGQLASVTDALGTTTAYRYTDDGLVATVTRTDGSHTFQLRANTYDAAGHLTRRTANNGTTTTTYTVDAAGRVATTTVDPGAVNRTTTDTYSPDDAVVSTHTFDAAGGSVTDASYDPMGRMTSKTVYNDKPGHPTGWWALSEGRGATAADSSGLQQTGTLSANAAWTNGGVTFNGANTAVTTAGPVLNTASSFTVSAWVNLNSASIWQTIVGQDGSKDSGFNLQWDYSTGKWDFAHNNSDATGSAATRVESTAAATLGVWTHLVGTFDAGTGAWTLYVNGAVQGSVGNSTPWAATGPLSIGRGQFNGGASDWMSGTVSNVQVYQRTLSAADVAALYQGGRTGAALSTDRLTTSWRLDTRGLATSMTDPDGNVTGYAYDEIGQPTMTVAPTVTTESGGGTPVATHPVSSTGYDTFGEVVEVSDPDGNVTTTGYDADGHLATITEPTYTPPGASTPIVPVTTRTYNNLGEVSRITDPSQATAQYVYDQLGNLATVTMPDSGVTHSTYDSLGERLTTTDPTGALTAATYDYLGHTATTTQVVRQPVTAANTTQYTYNSAGWLASTRTPAGVVTARTYDNLGQRASDTDGAGNTTRYSYDSAGHQTDTIRPDGTAERVTYDQAGRPIATSSLDAAGTVLTSATTSYDADGNQVAATDRNGHTTTFTTNALGWVTSEVQPVTASTAITTSFGYDAAGNRTRFTDGRGNAFITTYNSLTLVESQIEPATTAYPDLADRTFTTAYDANGRPVSHNQPGGVTLADTYDVMGNLTAQSGTGAEAATTTRTFGYDQDGRPTTAAATGGTDTFTYDDRGLLLSAGGPSGSSSFTYTPDGNMASRTDASGTTSYTYDPAGRLQTLADAASATTLTYGYNTLGQVAAISFGAGADTRRFGYDSLHRVVSDTLTTAGGVTVARVGYGYDNNGNATSKTTTGFGASVSAPISNTYTYDDADRLTSWNNGTATVAYGYDAAGNRTQIGGRVLTYNARNELTNDGSSAYTYTARGTQASAGAAASTNDAFGQTITQGAQSYTYDALGRLLSTAGASTHTLAYSGAGNQVASDATATYSRDPSGALTGVASGGAGRIAWSDQHDDLVGMFIASGNGLAGSAVYDPLGTVVATTGFIRGNLSYQSGFTDSATGRVNMGARWYNLANGQFDNRDSYTLDPVPNSVAGNRYAYVDDNPLTGTDPSGHMLPADGGPDAGPVPPPPTSASGGGGGGGGCHDCTDYSNGDPTQGHLAYPVKTNRPVDGDTGRSGTHHDWTGANPFAQATCPHDGSGRPIYMTNCTTYHDDGSNCWVDGHRIPKSALSGVQCNDIAQKIDDQKSYVTGPVDPDAFINAALPAAVAQAAQHEADLKARAKAVKCQQSFWCRNAGAIGAVAGVVAGLGCGLAVGWTGAGAVACGFVGGFVGSLTTGLLQGQSITDPGLWLNAVIGGAVGAVGGGVGFGVGALVSRAATTALGTGLNSVIGRAAVGALGGAVSGAATGGATGALGYGIGCLAGAGCTVGGLATAVAHGAGVGAVAGAVGGAIGAVRASCHSFDPATPVLLADGTSRAIGQVRLGDRVVSSDPVSGASGGQPVVALHINQDTDLTDITVRTDAAATVAAGPVRRPAAGAGTTRGPTATLHTTAHHQFWDRTVGGWVNAAALVVGHMLAGPAGATATVTAVHTHPGVATMRDLTIANTHTYYVIAGNTPVLVHNCGGDARFVVGGDGVTTDRAGARFVVGGDGAVTDTVGGSNAISLGRYPDYVRNAQRTGSNTFDVGDAWEGMAARTDRFGGDGPDSEIWIRNSRFLDQGIARGSLFRLASNPLDPANEGSFFTREIAHLQSRGYTIGSGYMLPPA